MLPVNSKLSYYFVTWRTVSLRLSLPLLLNTQRPWIAAQLTNVVFIVSGLLNVGDIIKEIDGQEVTDPDVLTEMMRKAQGSITREQYDKSTVKINANKANNPGKLALCITSGKLLIAASPGVFTSIHNIANCDCFEGFASDRTYKYIWIEQLK